jgi:hypothetical protein
MTDATPDAFASASQMADRSDGAIPSDRPFLDFALAAATEAIRSEVGWRIAPQATETFTLDGDGSNLLMLPTGKLVALVAITENGLPVDTSDVSVSASGMLWRNRLWADGFGTITVTITHGYADVPPAVADLTLQIAARALGSPLGVLREQSLASSVTWSTTATGVAGGTVILDHEKDQLAPYRLE